MPILIVKLCATPTPERSRCVAAALTDLTVEVLKKKRELTAVAIEYVPAAEWFIAGKTLASQSLGTFNLDIKVTEGTNTKDEKAHYVSRVFAALEEIIGPLAQRAISWFTMFVATLGATRGKLRNIAMFAASRFRANPSFQGVLRDEGAQHSLNSNTMGLVAFFLGRHGYRAGCVRPVTGEQSLKALATPGARNLIANRG